MIKKIAADDWWMFASLVGCFDTSLPSLANLADEIIRLRTQDTALKPSMVSYMAERVDT